MASKATVTTKASSASSVEIIAANADRNRCYITNKSTAILYVLLGSGTATATTAHSLQMAANTNYDLGDWRGAIQGIWASANGSAQVTELE